MDTTKPRIFLYLRLSQDGEILIRTKIREFRALSTLLGDMLALVLEGQLDKGQDLSRATFEYIDANTEHSLLSLCSKEGGLRVSGSIPEEYHERMLGEESERAINMKSFLERVGPNLEEEEKQRLTKLASTRHGSLLKLIRQNMTPTGEFSFWLGSS